MPQVGWSLRQEAKWLGLLPGWDSGVRFPRERYPEYARGLRARWWSFEGDGPLNELDR